MQRAVAKEVKLPPGYSISWSGQFEFLERATARLKIVVPATLLIILVLLYLTFRRFDDVFLIMATLPFALVGGFWLLFLLGYHMSIAAAVGFIALGGVLPAPLLSLFVIPAAYFLLRRRKPSPTERSLA